MEDKQKIREERIQTVIQEIVSVFQSGDVPKAIAIATFPPYAGLPSNSWSLLNRPIMHRNETCDGRGISQWNEVGRNVKKGSKTFYIFAPRMVKKNQKSDNGNAETKEEKEYFLAGFIPVPIFKVEQTEGDPLDYEPYELPEFPLLDKARAWGIDVQTMTFQGWAYGEYSNGIQEKIRIATPHESVFFHEISHAAHRRVKGQLKPGQNPIQEIVAELSAQVLAQLVGTEVQSTLGNAYKYISHYSNEIGKDIGMVCISVISEVEKADLRNFPSHNFLLKTL